MNESTLVPREEMSDLDWLARNVHEWPAGEHQPWCYVYWKGGHRAVSGNRITVIQPCVQIEKSDWLARRAELQNKPSWADAPEWAEWLAQDEDGEWKWLGSNPSKYIDGWTANKLSCCKKVVAYGAVIEKGTILGDWRDTLEKRPADLSEQAVTARLKDATNNVLAAVPELMTDKYKFTPFTSSEDNQKKNMKQDNGWFERGELPPVGARVNVDGPGLVYGDGERDCEVLTHVEDTAVVRMSYGLGCFQSHVLSPSRTAREVLIDVIKQWDGLVQTEEVLADAILAAGFKRDGGEK